MRIDDAVDHAGGVHPQQRRPSGRRDAASEGVNRPLDRNLHRPRRRPDDVDRRGILNAAVGHAISRDPARQPKTKLRMVGTLGILEASDIGAKAVRSEEHTSELQSLMRISYAVFCLKKKKKK